MFKYLFKNLVTKSFCAIVFLLFTSAKVKSAESPAGLNKSYCFVENKGQLKNTDGKPSDDVAYYVQLNGVNIFFTRNAIVYDYTHIAGSGLNIRSKASFDQPMNQGKQPDAIRNHYRVDMQFNTKGVQPIGLKRTGELRNYYLGDQANQWIAGVNSYKGLRYPEFYPGIDLLIQLKEDGSGIKYDFEIQAGAKPEQISYQYIGATSVRTNNKGQLVIESPSGFITEDAPFTYQYVNGQKEVRASSFVKQGDNIGFAVNDYAADQKLIIDPSVLVWSTYYGGNGNGDQALHLSKDADGNLVMIGACNSTNFPVSPGASQSIAPGGDQDAFIVKFTPEGTRLWATYYGGSRYDVGRSCATDSDGNIFIIGTTSSMNIPTVNLGNGAYFKSFNLAVFLNPGNFTAFLGKFSATGQMLWSTYFGGSTGENGIDVWVDADNNLIASGSTASPDFPVTSGAWQSVYGGPATGTGVFGDAYVVKFNNAGVVQWGTFIGGAKDELGYGITTNEQGDVFICGRSESGLATTAGAYQTSYGGGSTDGFIGMFSSSGTNRWLSYYGGQGDDVGIDIVYLNNHVYMAGAGGSNLSGSTAGVAQANFGGGDGDGYVVKWKPENNGQVVWRTYVGGSLDDGIDEIAVNPSGNIICGGWTNSSNYPVSPNAYQEALGGDYDGHLVTFDQNGQRLCASYFGGYSTDNIYGIAAASNGDIFVTGYTGSSTGQGFNTTEGAFQAQKSNGADAFLARISEIPEAPVAAINANPSGGCAKPLSVSFSNLSWSNNTCYSNTEWEWSFPGGTPSESHDEIPPVISYGNTLSFTARLIVKNAGGADTANIVMTVKDTLPDPQYTGGIYCPGQAISSLQISNSGENQVKWYTDESLSNQVGTGDTFNPPAPGTWYVMMEQGICKSKTVTVVVPEQIIKAKVEMTLNPPLIKPFELIANSQSENADSCTWLLNNELFEYENGSSYMIEEPGDYTLKLVCINPSGCEASDSVKFTVLDNKFELIIPNVFTPDNDSHNDLFAFQFSGIKNLNGTIFNRWGKEIYSWDGTVDFWDGTINGKEAADGVYFYVVEVTDIFDKKLAQKGSVTLIRKN